MSRPKALNGAYLETLRWFFAERDKLQEQRDALEAKLAALSNANLADKFDVSMQSVRNYERSYRKQNINQAQGG